MNSWVNARDNPPISAGWYATVHCYDPVEGFFPGAHCWDGKKWEGAERVPIILRSPSAFETHELAETWAYENDPENGDR